MDLKELRRMTLPKLRDLAKQETDLKGVIGMEKEALIEAIAQAKSLSYDVPAKDSGAIHSIKHDIRELRKQKTEILASSKDRKKLKRVQSKIRKLKRLTRHLAREAKQAKTPQPAAAAQPSAPAQPSPTAG
jgi:hypothetical protein